MPKLQAVKFTYQHEYPGNELYSVNWPGYTGGDIPAGLIVARLSGLGDFLKATNLWSVFHKSGYPVDYGVALKTRKQAIALAKNLGDVAAKHDLDWDLSREEIMAQVYAADKWTQIRTVDIPDAIRSAMATNKR